MPDVGRFLQAVLDGSINGSVYALLGVGMVLYYRSSGVMNLAHGEAYLIAGLAMALLTREAGWGTIPAMAASLILAALFAIIVELSLLRSRLHWPPSSLIIVTLGVAFMVRGIAYLVVKTVPYSFDVPVRGPPFVVGNVFLSRQGLAAILVTLVVGIGVAMLLRNTVLGHAMTAAAEKPGVSGLMGISIGRMRLISYGLAGALAGVAAIMFLPLSFISYDSGLSFVVRGFIAAAIGNMVSSERALAGGFSIGIVEGLVGTYLNPLFRTPIVFGVFLVVMVLLLNRGVRFGGAARA